MTPPDANLDKQKRRHRGPLIGIGVVVVFAVALIAYWIAEEAFTAPGPEDAAQHDTLPSQMRAGEGQPAAGPTADEGGGDVMKPGDPDVEITPQPDPTAD